MKYIFQKTHNKIVSIMVAFDAGARAETGKYTPGIAHMLEHMIFKGTDKRHYLDIPKEVAFLGGNINAFTSHEKVAYYIDLPYENFEKGMEILSDIVLHSTIPEEEFIKEREVVLEEALSYKDSPTHQLSEAYDEAFHSGRLSTPIIGTEEDIKSFTRQEVWDFYKEFYNSESAILTISGDIDLDTMRETSQKLFGKETEFVRQTGLESHTYKTQDEPVRMHKDDLEQAYVWIAYPGLTIHDDDNEAFGIMKGILSSGMDSRLFTEVREKNNLCYGIGMATTSYLDVGDAMIYSSTRMKNVDKMIELIDLEVEKIKTELVTDEELERAKNKTRASIYAVYDSGVSLSQRRSNEAFYDIPSLEELSGRIEAVTKEDVMKIANKVFNNEYKMTFILGNEDRLEE